MSASSDPRDVADVLEALARRIRSDPSFARDAGAIVAPSSASPDAPSIEALDVLTDERSVTVTCEARNVDASHVRVSLLNGHLLIGLGEGPGAAQRDVALPAPVDEDAAVATFRNGVLDVVLPRRRA